MSITTHSDTRPTPERPRLLIWTLQRCGGTNLTARLQAQQPPPACEHEPFNPSRQFGAITQAWLDHADPAALQASMHEALAGQRLIKHVVDLVPWEVSQALAEASAALGWRQMFLYRRDRRERLLSLVFARRSGVWGPGHERDALEDPGVALGEPLPVKRLLEREATCAERLNAAWVLLRGRGAAPVAVAFEDIFQAPPAQAADTLAAMLRALDLSDGDAADARFAQDVLQRGDQRTRQHYPAFRGSAQLAQGLEKVTRFVPG